MESENEIIAELDRLDREHKLLLLSMCARVLRLSEVAIRRFAKTGDAEAAALASEFDHLRTINIGQYEDFSGATR